MTSNLLQKYMNPLLSGQRRECREVIVQALESGLPARTLYRDLIWPAMARVDQMYRDDRINLATEHLATRINRVVADHLQANLARSEKLDKRILICCADGETEELGAQMTSDLFEADGWDVFFVGSGIPHDEILTLVGQVRPDILLVFGSKPSDVPGVRGLITMIRDVNACPRMNIIVSGGVFNRAEELWREVKSDLFAETAIEALDLCNRAQPRIAEERVPDGIKKRRRRRRPPLLVQAEAQG